MFKVCSAMARKLWLRRWVLMRGEAAAVRLPPLAGFNSAPNDS